MVRGGGAGAWARPATGPCPATGKATWSPQRPRGSAVGTLVESATRCVLLLYLPAGRDAYLAGQAMR